MMKKILTILLLALFTSEANSQANFFPMIKVEFEKTTSVRQLMKDMQENNSWYEQNKDRYPVSLMSYYEFTGDTAHSIYKPGKEVPVDPRMWWRPVADKNVVYNNYQAKTTISQKPVFEETFLVEDSLLKIKWKITGDLRTIAGYECRKAVGIINDTIAVFAFYSDELLINGGPEGIHGLPGMILGVGIPRLHATWFATKVEVNGVNMKQVVAPTKGKKVNRPAMMTRLGKLAEEWGTYGSKMLMNFII
jgi:GLPGLI family protein